MRNTIQPEAKRQKKRQQHKKWRRLCTVLGAIVVFVTTYALILPAITQETSVYCGNEEHLHGESCYTLENACGVHEHSEECVQTWQELICILPEAEAHTHSETCYGESQTLLCTLPEVQPHAHTEACMRLEQELICILPEDETHSHNVTCYIETQTMVCTLEETEGHLHNETCYQTEQTLLCTLPESEGHLHNATCYAEQSRHICGYEDGHVHTDACKQETLTCEAQEHTHSLICYSNPNADLESAETWERNLPHELSGIYAEDLLAVAKTQLGYHESENNYTVTEDGVKKGYNRYGAWYGDHYGDWCAMYISFCLEYAEVENVPYEANCQRWIEALAKQGLYKAAEGYGPKAGDIVFFDVDGDHTADHVGIVENVGEEELSTIEGNSSNQVMRREYPLEDETILGYCDLPLNEETLVPVSATTEDGVTVSVLLPIKAENAEAYRLTVSSAEADTVIRALLTDSSLPKTAAMTYDVVLYKDGEAVTLTDALLITFEGLTRSYAVRQLADNALLLPEYMQEESKLTVTTDRLHTFVLTAAGSSCNEAEHIHTATCYDLDGTLHCTLTEHLHTVACSKRASGASSESIPAGGTNATHWHSQVYPYYQVSPYYIYKGRNANPGPIITFVLVPQGSKRTTWTADSLEWSADGTHNYEVAYCTDINTYTKAGGGASYKRLLVEDSPYSEDQRTKITAVIQNAYPFISLEQMKANMVAAGYNVSDGFDAGTATFSVQWRIWAIANNRTDLSPDSLNQRYVSEKGYTLNPITSARSLAQAQSDLEMVYEYLGKVAAQEVGAQRVTATQRVTAITENPDGTFTIDVEVKLNRVLGDGDNGTVTLSDESGNSTIVEIPKGTDTFTVSLSNVPETTQSLHISYYVELEHGAIQVYYYEGGSYQDMVGGRLEESEDSWDDEISLLEETSIQVQKAWVGAVGPQVEVSLLADGEVIDTVVLNAANGWSYTWTGLPVGTLKNRIVYTVQETPVPGYQTSLSGPTTGTSADNVYTITNTELTQEQVTSISVEKRWVGASGEELPTSVTVTLLANGQPYGKPIVLSEANNWLYIWEGLPKTDADGNPIVYTFEETPMEGFVPTVTEGTALPAQQSWEQQSDFTSGTEFVLYSSSGALANTADATLAWVAVDTNDLDSAPDTAIWRATTNGSGFTLTNKDTGNALTLSGSFFSYSFTATSSGSAITYTNGKLRSGSYYLNGISNGSGKTSWSSGTSFTLYGLVVSQKGSDHHYILTNTAIGKTVDVTLQKKDSETAALLQGAEFDLYLAGEGETLIPGTEVNGSLVAEKLTTDANGQITLTDLQRNVNYYLIETKAPSGYNRLLEPIVFMIDNDDQITILSGDMAQGGESLTVTNKPGYALPNTGGMGTHLYTIGGVLLILVGTVLLYNRKKREREAFAD